MKESAKKIEEHEESAESTEASLEKAEQLTLREAKKITEEIKSLEGLHIMTQKEEDRFQVLREKKDEASNVIDMGGWKKNKEEADAADSELLDEKTVQKHEKERSTLRDAITRSIKKFEKLPVLTTQEENQLGELREQAEELDWQKKFEKGILASFEKTIAFLKGVEEPKIEDILNSLVDGIPPDLLPGIKTLQKEHPEAYGKMKTELKDVISSETKEDKNKKIEAIVTTYSVGGESEVVLEGLVDQASALKKRLEAGGDIWGNKGVAGAEAELKRMKKIEGGIAGKIGSAGGFFKFLFLFPLILILAIGIISVEYALEKKKKH